VRIEGVEGGYIRELERAALLDTVTQEYVAGIIVIPRHQITGIRAKDHVPAIWTDLRLMAVAEAGLTVRCEADLLGCVRL
jgi:hypothetical protein